LRKIHAANVQHEAIPAAQQVWCPIALRDGVCRAAWTPTGHKLKNTGLLDRAISPATLTVLKEKLDWHKFVNMPDYRLIKRISARTCS
jgi:hypothetical protein